MFHVMAAGQAASISPAEGVGISIGAVALITGIAIAMHFKKKSPRIIGWLAFIVGIALAAVIHSWLLLLAGLSLGAIPVYLILTGYVSFAFLHDGLQKKGKAHRWMQPIFGLVLPALLLGLGGSIGHGLATLLHAIGGAATSTVGNLTGQ